MGSTMKVEVWSDVQCVWCYVGEARLKRAIAALSGAVEIVHRSYELQPGFPVEFDAGEYLEANRGMDSLTQDRVFAAMKDTAAREGLGYEHSLIQPTNSHLALELLHYARTKGLRQQLADRLYEAYFAEGRHIGSVDALVQIAVDVGVTADEARAVLESGSYREAVDRDSAAARALGARGVPFMVINDRYVVAGAVEAEELLRIFRQVGAE